jgi:hypothetical protein
MDGTNGSVLSLSFTPPHNYLIDLHVYSKTRRPGLNPFFMLALRFLCSLQSGPGWRRRQVMERAPGGESSDNLIFCE